MGLLGTRQNWKVYGPYEGSNGRRQVILRDGKKSTSMSYAKWLLEKKIGRLLTEGEQADHVDDNSRNDDVVNLQVLSQQDNLAKSSATREKELYQFVCPICKKPSVKELRNVKHNWKLGSKGPYCSHKCAGKASSGGGIR